MPKRSKNLFLWDVTPIVGERMVPGLSLDKRISVPPGASYDAQAIFIEEKCSVWHPDSISYVETNSELIYGINEYSKGEKSSITVIQEATDSFVVIEKQTLSGKTIIFQLSTNGTTAGAVVDDKGNFNAMEPFKSSDFPYHTAAFLLAILLIASTIMPEVKRDLTFVTSVLKNGDKAAPYASHRDNALYRLNDAVFFGLKDGFIDCVLIDGFKKLRYFFAKEHGQKHLQRNGALWEHRYPWIRKVRCELFSNVFCEGKRELPGLGCSRREILDGGRRSPDSFFPR